MARNKRNQSKAIGKSGKGKSPKKVAGKSAKKTPAIKFGKFQRIEIRHIPVHGIIS